MIYGVEVFVCWQTKLFVMGLKVAFCIRPHNLFVTYEAVLFIHIFLLIK